jgi:hypothetical protein
VFLTVIPINGAFVALPCQLVHGPQVHIAAANHKNATSRNACRFPTPKQVTPHLLLHHSNNGFNRHTLFMMRYLSCCSANSKLKMLWCGPTTQSMASGLSRCLATLGPSSETLEVLFEPPSSE